MATPSEPKSETLNPTVHTNANMLVVDVGKKQSKKRIRQLRRGRGRLLERINDTVADMQANGALKQDAQLVVFVVRRKKSKREILGW